MQMESLFHELRVYEAMVWYWRKVGENTALWMCSAPLHDTLQNGLTEPALSPDYPGPTKPE